MALDARASGSGENEKVMRSNLYPASTGAAGFPVIFGLSVMVIGNRIENVLPTASSLATEQFPPSVLRRGF